MKGLSGFMYQRLGVLPPPYGHNLSPRHCDEQRPWVPKRMFRARFLPNHVHNQTRMREDIKP